MRLKPIIPALLASALMAGPAFAQAEGPSQRTLGTTTDGKRIVSMVIYGEDPCPEGKDGEIVVCSRQPERDRYRLPKTFRKTDGQEERRSEEHTSELQSLMRNSYAVFCLKKTTMKLGYIQRNTHTHHVHSSPLT